MEHDGEQFEKGYKRTTLMYLNIYFVKPQKKRFWQESEKFIFIVIHIISQVPF